MIIFALCWFCYTLVQEQEQGVQWCWPPADDSCFLWEKQLWIYDSLVSNDHINTFFPWPFSFSFLLFFLHLYEIKDNLCVLLSFSTIKKIPPIPVNSINSIKPIHLQGTDGILFVYFSTFSLRLTLPDTKMIRGGFK